MLSLFNLPCTGFCEMSELLTVPCILIGNRQLPPDTRSMSLVEFSPQSASVADIEQSEAARANDTDIMFGAATISAKAATLDNRMVDFLVFMQDPHWPEFPQATAIGATSFGRIFLDFGIGLLMVESPQLMQVNVQVLRQSRRSRPAPLAP
jgi:hypothetical protein